MTLSKNASFALFSSIIPFFLGGSSALTPLYAIYREAWGFSPQNYESMDPRRDPGKAHRGRLGPGLAAVRRPAMTDHAARSGDQNLHCLLFVL